MTAIVVSLAFSSEARSQDVLRLSVTANENTAYGSPWDGFRMGTIIGSFMPELPTFSPPDLAVCIVAVESGTMNMDCYHKGGEKEPISLCHDSYDCSFDLTVPEGSSFGVVIYDIDGVFGIDRNDLVDVFVVQSDGSDLIAVESATRAAVRLISRTDVDVPEFMQRFLKRDRLTIKPGEELRRETAYKVLRKGECHASCRLSQSQITIDWSE